MDIDLLWCNGLAWKTLEGLVVTVLERLRGVLTVLGLIGLPVTDTGLDMVPSPSLAVRIRQEDNLWAGEVAAMLSVLDRRVSPV